MADLFCKVRYFRIGQPAPKNSCFKGTVTPQSIFGGAGSYFSYCERYVEKETQSLMNYTGRYGFTMSSEGYLDDPKKKEEFIRKGTESLSKENATVYEIVCSMKDYESASSYNLANQEQFAQAISRIMPVYLRSIGLDANNVFWWEDFHPENRTSIVPHPHIHLLFFEKEPSGRFDDHYGKLPRKAIDSFKRMFGNEMLKREDKSRYREMFNNINISKRNVLDTLMHTDLDRVASLKDLYAVLPRTGRLQINSANIAPYKETFYKVIDRILESRDCKDAWDSYVSLLEDYDNRINRMSGGTVGSRKSIEIEKTKEQIANLILSGRKGYDMENTYDELLKNANHKAEEGNKGRLYKDAAIVRDKLSGRSTGASVRRGINSLLAKRKQEIEKEIEEYLDSGGNSLSL